MLLSGPAVLLVGAAGVLLTVLYSFLKYHALGDLDIFIIFGILTVLGSTAAATGAIVWDALVLSVPLGIITVSVLHANNTVDIETDGAAGIKTFAMLLGAKASSILYRVYMVLPFLCIVVSVCVGWLHPLALICLIAAVPSWKNFAQAGQFAQKGLDAMKGLDQGSAQMQLVFSGLLSIGRLFFPGILRDEAVLLEEVLDEADLDLVLFLDRHEIGADGTGALAKLVVGQGVDLHIETGLVTGQILEALVVVLAELAVLSARGVVLFRVLQAVYQKIRRLRADNLLENREDRLEVTLVLGAEELLYDAF